MNLTLCPALLTIPLLCAAAASFAQQGAPSSPAQTAPVATASQTFADTIAPDAQKPSSIIAPAVDHLSQVVSQVQLERWKGSSRDETDANLRSVERNVSTILPQLVTAADAQPSSIAASLPLLRNLDALCAVMIRVSVTARANAPTPQAESLNGALTALQNARNTLADQVQTLAATQEQQLTAQANSLAFLKQQVVSYQSQANAATTAPATKLRTKKKTAQKAQH